MIALLATLIPLGIAAAIKPTLIALQLMVVSGPHWWPRARALALGAALPVMFFGILGLLGFSQITPPKPGEIDILGVSLRTVIGLGFLIASIWLLRPHPQLQGRIADTLQRKMQSAHAHDFFILGLILNGKAVTTYALLLPALHDIAVAEVSILIQGLALVLLYALVLSTVWLPIVIRWMFGNRVDFAKLSQFVIANNFRILGVMALVIGLYLTGSAALLIAVVERL